MVQFNHKLNFICALFTFQKVGFTMRIKQTLQWSLGCSDQIHTAPDTYIPASVPGAVQQDMKRAHKLPDYNCANTNGWKKNTGTIRQPHTLSKQQIKLPF